MMDLEKTPLSPLAESLLAIPSWLGYITESDEKSRDSVLVSLVRSNDYRSSELWERVDDAHEAEQHLNGIRDAITQLDGLSEHLMRGGDPLSRQWITESDRMLDSFYAAPSPLMEAVLRRHAGAASRLMATKRSNGSIKENHLRLALVNLFEETISSVQNNGRGKVDAWDHASFIKAFCKKCGVEAEEWRSCSNGVYVSFNAKDATKLHRSYVGTSDWVADITDDLGYLLCKKGMIPTGALGSNEWLFIKQDDSRKDEQEELDKTMIKDTGSKLKNESTGGAGILEFRAIDLL